MRPPRDAPSLGPRSARPRWLLTACARIGLGALVVLGVVFNRSDAPGLLAFLPYAIVGSLLVIRRPRHLIGWLLLLMAAGFGIVDHPVEVSAAAIATGTAPWLPLLAWLATMAGIELFAGLAVLSAVFPTGALPGGGIGRATRAALGLIAGVALLQAVDPAFSVVLPDGTTVVIHNPIGIAPGWPGWSVLDGPAYVVALGGIIVCIVGLLVRFRRAGAVERQQDLWLLASLALVAVGVAFGFVGGTLVDPAAAWIWIPAVFAFPLPPIAIGIAITRYRLYDIDRIVSRTISYAIVSAILALVFGGVILLLSAALASFTQGQTVAVAASTLAAFAIFQPVLRRVQRVVDRRFNRARYDAERTVAAFADRLRDEIDLDHLTLGVTEAVQRSLAPTSVGVWVRDR